MRSTSEISSSMSRRVRTRARGIVGRVDREHAGPGRHRLPQRVPVDGVVRERQRHGHRDAAAQLDRRYVGVVARFEDDHFVAGPDHRRDRIEQRFGSARRHRDLRFGIVSPAVKRLVLRGDRFAQRQHALHRRVLIAPASHVARHRFHQLGIAIEIGEALRQVDRAELRGEPRHHRENRRADRRQLGFELDHRMLSNTPVSRFFRTASQLKCCPFIAT